MTPHQDSHYVSKFLLRNWEERPGRLRYFDFGTGRIHRSSAEGMCVSERPFPDAIESWLGKTIETPLGQLVARLKGMLGKPGAVEATEAEARAVLLALLVQAHRTRLSKDPEHRGLDAFIESEPGSLDRIARLTLESHEVWIRFVRGRSLFYPSGGLVPFPVAGTLRSWLLPLTPFAYVALMGHDANREVLAEMLQMPDLPGLFSVGLRDERVILPPLTPEGLAANPAEIADLIRGCRSNVEKLIEAHHIMTHRLGRLTELFDEAVE